MSQIDEDCWIRFGEGQGLVALTVRPQSGPAYGFLTLVQFKAAQLEGQREVTLINVDDFTAQLRRMHETLQGRASIESLEHDLVLTLESGPLGSIPVTVRIGERWGGPVDFELKFKFAIDQSYLPTIIAGLSRQFSGVGR